MSNQSRHSDLTVRLAGVLAAGLVVAVAAAQSPTAPRLIGEAAPPASALSLWYRAPASDHPLRPLDAPRRSEEHTSELQSLRHLVCRLLLEKKKVRGQLVR